VIVQDYRPGQVTDTPVLSGTASDGGGVASVIVRVEQPDGTSLQQSAVQDGQTWRYFPELTLAGNHRMRVTAIDELGNTTRSETFDLLVIAAPDTHSNEFVTAEDTPVAFEPLLDDLDLDGDTLFLTGLGVPLHGTASISGTTWVVYTPTLNFNGTDAFTYTASDGGLNDTATVTVTVTPVNDPPVIVAGDAVSVTMSEDNAPVAFGLTLNAHDVDDGVLTWDVAQGAMHGTATVSGSLSVSGTLGFSSTIATLAYAPDQDYYGPDSFGVRVSDGELADTLLVNVTVEPVNDAPQAQDDMAVILLGEGDSTVTMDVLSNDADLEGQPLTISAVGSPANGNVMISDDRYLLYTPAITGTESFTYTVTDGGLSDTATVHVTVVEGDSSAGGGETVVLPGVGTNGTMTVTIGIPADVTSGGEHFALIFGETAPPNDAPRDYLFAGLAFTLDVYVNGVRMDTYAFTTPLSLTIEYQESDVAHLMMGDAELALFYRDAGQWRNDDVTVVARDLLNNRFAVTIDHLSRFALFGWDAFKDYLPLVRRGAG
jgi:hypothetical protein